MPQHNSSRSGSGDEKAAFLRDLHALRDEAGLDHGELAARAHYPEDIMRAAESGPALPALPVLEAYVRGCGASPAAWEDRWRGLMADVAATDGLPVRDPAAAGLPAPATRLPRLAPARLVPRPADAAASTVTERLRPWRRPPGRRRAAVALLAAAAAAVVGGALALALPGVPAVHRGPSAAAPRISRESAPAPGAVAPAPSASPALHRTGSARPAEAATPPPVTPPPVTGAPPGPSGTFLIPGLIPAGAGGAGADAVAEPCPQQPGGDESGRDGSGGDGDGCDS